MGIAQMLGKEGHRVARVGQTRVIFWDAFLRGSKETLACTELHQSVWNTNECKEREQTTNMGGVWNIANACLRSGRGTGD